MDDLAAELGMSKKTLYGLFSSKTDLLKAVLMAKFREVESDLSGIASNGTTDVLASLRELLACMRRHTEEIQPPFVRDMQREAPEIFAIVQGRRRDLIQRHFGKLFEAGR
ncbi:MAG TPA: helix-turn-helix domain-containing protein, partial [Candidatus Eisenbacteria bacterium]|nr:helix-turn-helix domain-containing protein [Candidatus Eisenbacteria bacterium]